MATALQKHTEWRQEERADELDNVGATAMPEIIVHCLVPEFGQSKQDVRKSHGSKGVRNAQSLLT